MKSINDTLKGMQNFSKEDILDALGLETKRGAIEVFLPAIGLFAAGVLVGVGVGMLFAPKAGSELREDLQDQYNKALGMAREQMSNQGSSGMSSGLSGSRPTSQA